jgi:hypothetical protein
VRPCVHGPQPATQPYRFSEQEQMRPWRLILTIEVNGGSAIYGKSVLNAVIAVTGRWRFKALLIHQAKRLRDFSPHPRQVVLALTRGEGCRTQTSDVCLAGIEMEWSRPAPL